MRTVLLVAAALACAFPCSAQITATLYRLPNGLEEIRIRNDAAISLVAFAVYSKQGPSRFVPLPSSRSSTAGHRSATRYAPFLVYSDPLIEPAAKPLLAGEERVVLADHVGSVRNAASGPDPSGRPLEELVLTAGVFADGATAGDAALLARLVLRRCNMLQAVELALGTLSDAGRHNIPRAQLIMEFKKMADSVRHWYLPPEQQVGLRVYQPIIGKLVNLPEIQIGSPFPPTSFVEQEVAILNRQRVTLLQSEPSLAEAASIHK